MKPLIYDKVKWHYGSTNRSMGLATDVGATHIAFMLRWCNENGLIAANIIEEFQKEFDQIALGKLTYRDFLISALDGIFDSELLNTRGQGFGKQYYSSERTKMARRYGWYLEDYDMWVEQLFGKEYHKNVAMYYVAYTEENYQKVAQIISKRYNQYLEMKSGVDKKE